jgi:hypothetical protein
LFFCSFYLLNPSFCLRGVGLATRGIEMFLFFAYFGLFLPFHLWSFLRNIGLRSSAHKCHGPSNSVLSSSHPQRGRTAAKDEERRLQFVRQPKPCFIRAAHPHPAANNTAAMVVLSAGDIVLEYVCPALGSITAWLMWLAPLQVGGTVLPLHASTIVR